MLVKSYNALQKICCNQIVTVEAKTLGHACYKITIVTQTAVSGLLQDKKLTSVQNIM